MKRKRERERKTHKRMRGSGPGDVLYPPGISSFLTNDHLRIFLSLSLSLSGREDEEKKEVESRTVNKSGWKEIFF